MYARVPRARPAPRAIGPMLTCARERAGVDISARLQQSLREEEAMAQWVDSHVEGITLQYLAKEEEAAA